MRASRQTAVFSGAFAVIDRIAVTTPPTKTVYKPGEVFDPAGMVVTATYSDNNTKDVTAGCVFTPDVITAAGNVLISYTENGITATTTQEITIDYSAELYNAGNEYPEITGGWVPWTSNGGTVSKNSANIYLAAATGGLTYRYARIAEPKAIDLTHINSIAVTYTRNATSSSYITTYLGVATTYRGNAVRTLSLPYTTGNTLRMDVSGLSGMYYVMVAIDISATNNEYGRNMSVTRLWIE